MTKEQVSALLGRPLNTTENTNFDTYLEIAKENLEDLLCLSLDVNPDGSGEAEETTQTFEIRKGYSTVFTGIFTSLTEVKVDGVATDDYHIAFWDKRSNSYYNSIVFDTCDGSDVEVTGYFGFAEIPKDLQRLWADAFAVVSAKRSVHSVKSKKVEDFSITYGDKTDDLAFIDDNCRIIRKYSLCNIGYVRHGEVCSSHGVCDCGYCI